eukprot:403362501
MKLRSVKQLLQQSSLAVVLCLTILIPSVFSLSYKEQKRLENLQSEIDSLNNGQHAKGKSINNLLKGHFWQWVDRVENNTEIVFSPIAKGIQEGNDEMISEELQYFVNCRTCQITMQNMFEGLNDPLNRQLIVAYVSSQCQNKYSANMCIELSNLLLGQIFDNIFEVTFEKDFICSYLFPICDSNSTAQVYKEMKEDEYITEILKDKPDFLKNDDFIDNLYKEIDEQSLTQQPETYNILQFSDWHVDFRYKEGANKNCKEEICCQADHGFPTKDKDKARKWGEYNCDIPYILAEKQMELLSTLKDEKIDMILWTGDQIGHDLHNISPQEIIENIQTLVTLIKTYFPNTPLIPTLGNHDFYPPNYQPFNVTFTDHLHQIGEIFRTFVTDNEAIEKFKEYGYYKTSFPESITKISGQKVGVIVLNTQVCYMYNFGLFNETNDAAKHLDWLKGILEQAEKENELLIIAGHMSPGDYNCVKKWSVRYQALLERYQHLLRLSVYGHDHRELFDIIRGKHSDKPIHVNQVAGSLGTFTKVNPSVRIFKMHAKHHVPIEMKVYELDIEEANRGKPRFQLMADFKKDYGLKNLSPSEYSKLSERFLIDEEMSQRYHLQALTFYFTFYQLLLEEWRKLESEV